MKKYDQLKNDFSPAKQVTQQLIEKDQGANEEDKIKNERIAILIGIAANFMLAVNLLCAKMANMFAPSFSCNNYSMWRAVGLGLISYYKLRNKKSGIPQFSEINSKGWFLTRTVGNYVVNVSIIMSIVYLRAATASCIAAIHPFIVITLSIVILKEKFHMRYLTGMLICFAGTALIILNERKSGNARSDVNIEVEDHTKNAHILIGVFFITLHVISVGFALFAQKMVVREGITSDVQILYVGITNFMCGFVCAVYELNLGLNFTLIGMALLNSVFFYLACMFTDMALVRMDISKFAPLAYFQTFFVFNLSFFLFGEAFYLSDIIGSLMIMSFHVYNVYDPIKSDS